MSAFAEASTTVLDLVPLMVMVVLAAAVLTSYAAHRPRVRVADDSGRDDPAERVRARYVEGELDEDELETLLEVELSNRDGGAS